MINMTNTELLDRLKQITGQGTQKDILLLINKAKVPLLILLVCIILSTICMYSIINLLNTSKKNNNNETVLGINTISRPINNTYIYVDLSGSVNKPNTYRIVSSTRLFELIELAGGLSLEADKAFVSRNYNLSVVLYDQQKVHIPSIYEVRDGIFIENNKLVNLANMFGPADNQVNSSISSTSSDTSISINNATLEMLKMLPGVGDVTASRIIATRPYESIQQLVDKGVIKQTLLDKISPQLEL